MKSANNQTALVTVSVRFRKPRPGDDPEFMLDQRSEVSGRAFVALLVAAGRTAEILVEQGATTLEGVLWPLRRLQRLLRDAAKDAVRTPKNGTGSTSEAANRDQPPVS
jgi:hypothetical protein